MGKSRPKKETLIKKTRTEFFMLFLQIFTAIAVVVLGILNFNYLQLPQTRMELFSNTLNLIEVLIPDCQATLDEEKIEFKNNKDLTFLFSVINDGEYTFVADKPIITIYEHKGGKLQAISQEFYSVRSANLGRCAPNTKINCATIITFRNSPVPKNLFVRFVFSAKTDENIVKIAKQLIENSGKEAKSILTDDVIKTLSEIKLSYGYYLYNVYQYSVKF